MFIPTTSKQSPTNTDDLQAAVSLTETPTTCLIPIETVSLGARIPTKNPRPEDYDFQWPEPEESSWVQLTMEWRKTDGGIVDAELLRPRDWVEASRLEAGSIFNVYSTELELSGVAEVMAISECPPLSAGDGEVVTGRFVTRKADETVRLTFETGDTLEGSRSHPIWSPAIQDWVPMEEWTAGDAVLGREGWMTVTSVEVRNESVPLYNIEVRGEHVYEVTEAGLLVHNSGDGVGGCNVNPGGFGAVTAALDIVRPQYRNGVNRAFDGDPEVVTLTKDLIVYRRYGGGSAETGSPWFSMFKYAKAGNAKRYLALPEVNTAERLAIFKIPKGTTILKGKAASMVGEPGFGIDAVGGGQQIYLPNPGAAIRMW